MTTQHLWEMKTSWFDKPDSEYIHSTFPYKSWKDFQEYKPYKLWKPYILSSWCWKKMDVDEKPILRRETDKSVYDCSKILRVHPTIYDKEWELSLSSTMQGKQGDMLQIVFISPDRFSGMHRVEMFVKEEDEEAISQWLKNHMPSFWKL